MCSSVLIQPKESESAGPNDDLVIIYLKFAAREALGIWVVYTYLTLKYAGFYLSWARAISWTINKIESESESEPEIESESESESESEKSSLRSIARKPQRM